MAADTKINDLITSALRRHHRRNAEVITVVQDEFPEWVKDLCLEYPYWFLRNEPGNTFQQSLPLTQTALEAATPLSIPDDLTIDYWLDRGVLRTEAGVDLYRLAAPAETPVGDVDGDFWALAKCQKPLWVARMGLNGEYQDNLTIPRQNVLAQSLTSTQGTPCLAYFESGREGDYLRLVPTPDKAYIIHVAWVLSQPLNYFLSPSDVGANNYTNKLLQEYSEVCSYAIQLKAAEYFRDAPEIQQYQTILYGAPLPNSRNTMGAMGGKVGNMKREHLRKSRTQTNSVPVFRSNPNSSYAGRKRRGEWPGYFVR